MKTYRDESVLASGEVAKLFRVDPKTVTRWAIAGKVPSFKTPAGTRRFRYAALKPYLNDGATS